MQEFNEYELHSPESLFHEGMDLLESDHFEEALGAFEKLVRVQPYNADAYFQRGITLIKLNRASDAVASFETAISLSPTEAMFHSHCGYAHLMAGHHDAALERFDYALHLQPGHFEHLLLKACVLIDLLHLTEAQEILEKLREERPDEIEVMRHLATVFAMKGDDHEALRLLRNILSIDPNNTDAIRQQGVISLKQGNRAGAVRFFREYLALLPEDVDTWRLLLETLTEMDQPESVIGCASEAIQSHIEYAFIYLFRGRALLEQRQYNDAIMDLRRSRSLDDRNSETHFLLAQAFSARGRHKHALLSVNRMLQLLPGERKGLMLKTRLCQELQDYEEEAHALNQLIRLNPNDFQIVQLKVKNQLHRDSTAGALQTLNLFLRQSPRHARALLLNAEIAEKAQQFDLAKHSYKVLLSQQPVNARTYRSYAGFLLRQHSHQEAASVLEVAFQMHPTNADIQMLRAIVYQLRGQHLRCINSLTAFMESNTYPPEFHWLLGKSWYAERNYKAALENFQNARVHGASYSVIPDVPEFKCLMAEAYSLHHLGRTVEGIALLEEEGRRFEDFGQEFHEILAEFYNHICAYAKACAVATDGLIRFPKSPVLHYRLARCSAALNRKRTALRHLEMAIQLDPQLVLTASNDNRFQRYALSPTMNRLVGFYFYKRRLEFLGLLLVVFTIVAAIAWFLQ